MINSEDLQRISDKCLSVLQYEPASSGFALDEAGILLIELKKIREALTQMHPPEEMRGELRVRLSVFLDSWQTTAIAAHDYLHSVLRQARQMQQEKQPPQFADSLEQTDPTPTKGRKPRRQVF